MSIDIFQGSSAPDDPCVMWLPLNGNDGKLEFTVTYYDPLDANNNGSVWDKWGEKQIFPFSDNSNLSEFIIKVPATGMYIIEPVYKGNCDICYEVDCSPLGQPEWRGKSDIINEGAKPPSVPLFFDECDCCD